MQTQTFLFGVIFSISFTVLNLLPWGSGGVDLVRAQSQQSCHLRELDLCAASLLILTQAPGGLASSEQEINKQCVQLKEADNCMRNYTRRCMTPMQRELVFYAANSSMQLMQDYCTRGSSLRTNYLKHAKCLNQIGKKEQKSCFSDLQNSIEMLTSGGADATASSKKLQLGCCAYKRFEACIGGPMEKRCGKEATSFVNGVVRRATSRLPETMCRSYKHDSQECRALLPKAGIPPKGSKSNSIVSRLLSAYSGL